MFLQIIIASLAGSILALIGGVLLLWNEKFAKRISLTLVSFAAGSLIGAAFLELIPEAAENTSINSLAPFIIVGIFLIFIFEKFLNWYHCHDQETCDVHSFSSSVIFGDAIHNFIDGIAIALSFSISTELGIATTVAVFFHEVPQEIGDFGVLLHAGYTRAKVLAINIFSALTTVAGAILGYLMSDSIGQYTPYFLAFAAGSFIYIAVSDLLPEIRHRSKANDFFHIFTIILGVLVIWVVGIFFHE
ncbi:MAG: ZIP family metal transporter [Patescibacteria group bacterium]